MDFTRGLRRYSTRKIRIFIPLPSVKNDIPCLRLLFHDSLVFTLRYNQLLILKMPILWRHSVVNCLYELELRESLLQRRILLNVLWVKNIEQPDREVVFFF